MPDERGRLKAALGDRYRIERELGTGAMATVYLAEDLKHRRKVAVKVLHADLAAALGRRRFVREIEIAAHLSHPHILPLHDSDEADGFLYYVMPYVAGGSLRDRLHHEGQLPVADALQLAREVADALASAHHRGVIHRDIKPENILLEEGHATVADFGIARAVTAAGGQQLTEARTAVGTPAYMSPEQAAGERHVDGRTDVYSLGCVLYEMLAGRPPFTGSYQAILSQQVSRPPPRVRDVRAAVSPKIDRIVAKALAPAPEDRFRSAEEIAEALRAEHLLHPRARRADATPRRRVVSAAWTAGILAAMVAAIIWSRNTEQNAASVDPDVVAVFPFRVDAPDTSLEYLRDGMVVLLHTRFTGDGAPRAVDPTTAIITWNREVTDERGLASEGAVRLASRLGAGQVLLGSPNEITVTASLLDVPGGDVRVMESVAGADDELSTLVDRLVARLLFMRTAPAEGRVAALSNSLTANKSYLAGQEALRRQDWWAARERFGRALEIDSSFALAALALVELGERIGVDRHTVEVAWELQDRLPPRERTYLRALSWVGPNYPAPSTWLDVFDAMRTAAAVAPDRSAVFLNWGTWLLAAGALADVPQRLEQATALLDSALALNPTLLEAMNWRLEAAILRENPREIRRWAARYLAADSSDIADARRWWVAVVLGDSLALRRLRPRLHEISNLSAINITARSITEGIPLDDAERAVEQRWRQGTLPPFWRVGVAWSRAVIAAAQGRAGDAAVLLDSVVTAGATDSVSMAASVINLALTEPGYERAGASAASLLATITDTSRNPDGICHDALWRVAHGDTSNTRRAIVRFNSLVSGWRPPEDVNDHVGQFGVCPLLLEAMLEGTGRSSDDSPALDRLEALMRRGPRSAINGALANLVIAQWREERGEVEAALAAVRRRPHTWGGYKALGIVPLVRQEGRLAALAGDTASAIRAYDHYLTLRTHSDPAVRPQVDSVRAELAALVGEDAGSARLGIPR